MSGLGAALLWVFALLHAAQGQFGFFEQVFGGGGQQSHQPQNVPSDSAWYRSNVEAMQCDRYLCPDTLGTSNPPSALFSPYQGHE